MRLRHYADQNSTEVILEHNISLCGGDLMIEIMMLILMILANISQFNENNNC